MVYTRFRRSTEEAASIFPAVSPLPPVRVPPSITHDRVKGASQFRVLLEKLAKQGRGGLGSYAVIPFR